MVRAHADGSPKPHQGWDFYAPVRSTCYAVGAGEVVFAGENGALGLTLIHKFQHDDKTCYATYAHMSSLLVSAKKGKANNVDARQAIGQTGKSGNAINLSDEDMHLHFEVRVAPFPGLGLTGRLSPVKIFGVRPLETPVVSPPGVPDVRHSRHGLLVP